ncbi:uncharacterized protein [Clytia hemisphaerica]|uniref:Uncharacterized protein n=1 Tax=Clytia hemisphaerica TaxID=252671 RepID=A0A7M5TQ83_9CNID
MDIKDAKITLKELLSTGPEPVREASELLSPARDFHRKFAEDLESIPVDVPFKMLFVQHGGEIRNAAIIPEHVLNSLREKDPEAHEMFAKFNDPIEMDVSFDAAGNYFVSKGTKVGFGGLKVYNVNGSAVDKRGAPWINFWQKAFNKMATICYINSPDSAPHQKHTTPLTLLGGHMELANPDQWWYILPICPGHNSKKFDRGASGGVMVTDKSANAVQITKWPNPL